MEAALFNESKTGVVVMSLTVRMLMSIMTLVRLRLSRRRHRGDELLFTVFLSFSADNKDPEQKMFCLFHAEA